MNSFQDFLCIVEQFRHTVPIGTFVLVYLAKLYYSELAGDFMSKKET